MILENQFYLLIISFFLPKLIYAKQIFSNSTTINNSIKHKDNMIILYFLLVNLILLLVVFIGFCIKIGYKKYIDNTIVI